MKAALQANRNVFKFLVKQSAETSARSESGRLFHARGAATANVRLVMNTCAVLPQSPTPPT